MTWLLMCVAIAGAHDKPSACWGACLKDGYDDGSYSARTDECLCVRRVKFSEMISPPQIPEIRHSDRKDDY